MGTETNAVLEFRQQSRLFLARARTYLAEGDLHQASEKGWGAAAHMVKAVAEALGQPYRSHDEFGRRLVGWSRQTGDDRLRQLRLVANELHGNYYKRETLLDAEEIASNLNDIQELLDRLEPLIDARPVRPA